VGAPGVVMKAGGLTPGSSRPPDEELTEFGRLYYFLCEELHMSGKDVALHAGMDGSTLSRNTRSPTVFPSSGITHPSRKTVTKILAAMSDLARTKSIPWNEEEFERYLLHSASYATLQDVAEAESYYQERRRTQRKTPPDLAQHDVRGISPSKDLF